MTSPQLSIQKITAAKLKAGKLEDVLPEFYSLKQITEKNDWHTKPNVFDHAISVLENFERLVNCHFLSAKTKKLAKKHMQKKIDRHSREELLKVAVLIHDISKKDAIIADSMGITACPGYEILASGMVRDFQARFDLSDAEVEYVQKLVLYHGFAHDILRIAAKRKPQLRYYKLFQNIVGPQYIELLIFAYSDMLGSDVVKQQTADFRALEKVLIKFLEKGLRDWDKKLQEEQEAN